MNPSIDSGTGPRASRLGRVIRSVSGRVNHRTRADATGATGQATTFTASNGTEDAEYVVRFRAEGVDETITAIPGASTALALVEALEAAVVDNPLIMAHAEKVTTTATTVVVTALSGVTFAITLVENPSTHLSVAQVAATDAPQYTWGRAVQIASDGRVEVPEAIDGAEIELTIGHDTENNTHTLRLLVDGEIQTITWDEGGSAGATDTAAKTALEAADFIAEAVINSTGDVDAFGMPGVVITVVDTDAEGSSTLAAALTTQADPLPTLGLVAHDRATPFLDGIPAPSGPLPGAAVLTAGPSGTTTYGVEAPGAAISGTAVYVETSGSDAGRLYDAPSATRIPWPQAEWVGLDDADPTLAHIRL